MTTIEPVTEVSKPDNFPEGTKVRLTRAVADLSGGRTRRVGFEFVVETYVPADEAEDGQAFYWGSSEHGGNDVTVPADAVELVMTAEAMRNRLLPTITEFTDALRSDLCGMDAETFETDETVVEGDGLVLIAGRTTEGLRFAAYVRVESITHADF